MKNKIIDSFSNPNTGLSGVTIQNKYGRFTGYAYYNSDDDIANFSRFAGERYAEIRAYIEYAKYRYKQEKLKLQTIQELVKDMENNHCSLENMPDKISRRINLKLRDYNQSVSDWKNLYTFFEARVKEQIQEREKILNKDYKSSIDTIKNLQEGQD